MCVNRLFFNIMFVVLLLLSADSLNFCCCFSVSESVQVIAGKGLSVKWLVTCRVGHGTLLLCVLIRLIYEDVKMLITYQHQSCVF